MRSTVPRLAMIVTDAVSFNVLYQGQLEYLRDKGIRLTLFCGGTPEERARLKARELGRVIHVPMARSPQPLLDIVSLIWLTALLAVHRFDATVYSTPKALLLGSLGAFLTGQRRRTAIVHGRAYEECRGIIRRMFLALDRVAFACSHQVLFVSHSLKDAYKADGVGFVQKGRVLGFGSCNGVDLTRFRPVTSEAEKRHLRADLGLPTSALVILIVGRLTPDKGIDEIAQIIECLGPDPRLFWVFVGQAEDSGTSARLNALKVPNVVQVGFSGEVEYWFRASDLHLFLSHREGFGNVAIEAAASGLPTFAFDVVGVRDSVTDGVTGILFQRAHGVEPIVCEITAALADRDRLSLRFPRIREVPVERYDKQSVWDRYLDAYFLNAQRELQRPSQIRNPQGDRV